MFISMTYILTAGFGTIPFRPLFLLICVIGDYMVITAIGRAWLGSSDEALTADDLEDSDNDR